MVFYFASAFYTIQPVQLGHKRRKMQLDVPTVFLIMDYVTNKQQYVML